MPYKNKEERNRHQREYAGENPYRNLTPEQKVGRRKSLREYRKRNPHRVREWERNARKKRRLWINSVKDVPCKDCGIKYPPYIMQFDHLKGKKFMVSNQLYNLGIERLKAEIAKCDVICANCHAIRTWKERGKI